VPSHSGDGVYELHGHEWFCSYPPCEAFLELAQAPGGARWTASAASDSDGSAGWCAEHREHALEELMRRGVDNRGIGFAVALGDNKSRSPSRRCARGRAGRRLRRARPSISDELLLENLVLWLLAGMHARFNREYRAAARRKGS
jgi:hypothetical protein